MDTLEALVLGLIQGLTEYLPVSSSGHLAIGSAIFDVDPDKNMMFTVLVHVATVLSTLVVLGGQIWKILKGMFSAPAGGQGLAYFNEDQRYVLNIVVSMIPIGIVGLFFKKQVEAIFGNGLPIVGCCLLLTAALLTFSYYARPRQKVIPPILGEALLDFKEALEKGVSEAFNGLSVSAMIVGFLAAFISGMAACKWMINIVSKGKLIYFAYYCVIAGVLTIVLPLILGK